MEGYVDFKKNILLLTGIDLNLYKEAQMKRRIDTFIQRQGIDNYNEFLSGMKQNQKLLHSFVSYLTINVTEFNRNPDQWKIFENKIIPMFRSLPNGPIKIWSAATSTGEEAYTIAMYMSKYFLNTQYKILATDIDTDALEKGKEGIYTIKELRNLPEDILTKYFRVLDDNKYTVKKNLKSQIEFTKHNLLTTNYPKDVDIIVCRNVTIYFTQDAKAEVFKRFAGSLRQGGILFIGNTEQILHPEQYGLKNHDTFFYKKL